MPFQKGQSGNPGGRKKGSKAYITQLHDAIKRVETKKGKKLLTHFVEQAFEDKMILIALLKKLIADKKEVDVSADLYVPQLNDAINALIKLKQGKHASKPSKK